MFEVALMLEGQIGLTWEHWKRLVRAAEALGFVGVYRSDHFTNTQPPDQDSLELWVSLTWLASHTERIEFGPLVTPLSFRHPVHTARMASQVDDLSGGRLTLGLGAGWQEREHANFGWELLDVPDRLERFEDGLQVVTRLLKSDTPSEYRGRYYQIHDAVLLPRPQRPGGPPILIGGNGLKRTLPLAVKYADWWNGVFLTPEQFALRNTRLDELLAQAGRSPGQLRRSLMTTCVFASDEKELEHKVRELTGGQLTVDEFPEHGRIAGTANAIVDRLGAYAEVGVQRIMLQWLYQEDLDSLEAMANAVLPQVQA